MALRVSVIALDDVFDTGLASVVDTFETANELAGDTQFAVSIVGVRARVRTHLGFTVPAVAPESRAPDLAVVPALACKQPDTILAAITRADVADAIALLARWSGRGAHLAAACTGTFVLAASGVLDGHRATTTWWLGPTFRKRFPAIELDDGEMLVRDGSLLTAGAALAHVDLALAIVRAKSPDLASLVARHLLVDARPSQATFMAPAYLQHDDELVRTFERWIRKHLPEPFDLARAAKAVGASERTLQRRIRAVLGKPPIAFVQDLRLERAVHLLRVTRDTVDDVAARVGYQDASTLRTLLRRRLNTGIRELRGGVGDTT
jgi:transcriptional regulator GlxA family with amidase domain|nr:helix-turn-helix domain-containing protein [Kofleriaceae bacterium]